jgi:hypothetical protein
VYLESNANARDYEIVGHFIAMSGQIFLNWRDYCLECLLGGLSAVAQKIVNLFVAEPKLGLVFPAEPYYSTWDEASLSSVRDFAVALEDFQDGSKERYDFPEGGMFWARRSVMQKLAQFTMNVSSMSFSQNVEAERLLPLACRASGFYEAVSFTPAAGW